jgi:hypothetical protein
MDSVSEYFIKHYLALTIRDEKISANKHSVPTPKPAEISYATENFPRPSHEPIVFYSKHCSIDIPSYLGCVLLNDAINCYDYTASVTD